MKNDHAMKRVVIILSSIVVAFFIFPAIGIIVSTYKESKEIIKMIDYGCHISVIEQKLGKAQPHRDYQSNDLPDRLSQFNEIKNKGLIYTEYWVEGIQPTKVAVGRNESGNIVWGYVNGAFIEDVIIINEEYLVDNPLISP